jgi:hypothetical protein
MPPEDSTNEPLPDVADEARRIASTADRSGVMLRVVGGVAVALRCPSASKPPLERERSDIDVAAHARSRGEIERLIAGLGYQPERTFNALSGQTRLLFWDVGRGRQLDVFFDRIDMCHTIELANRFEVDELTLPLADLLLMKLQVVETNRKDLDDIVALVLDHELTPDDSGINIEYLGALVARDWGLWRTTTMVARRALEHARAPGMPDADRAIVHLERLLESFDEVPKTRRWKMRARVGERVRWYELPEEAH